MAAMRIDETNQQVMINPIRNERPEQVAGNDSNKLAEASSKPQASKDNVALSPAAERLNKATEALKSLPDSRPERVQEVKTKVDSGDYSVNSKDVAAKMLSTLKNGYS